MLSLYRGDTFLETLAYTANDGPSTLEHVTVTSSFVDARGASHAISVTKSTPDYLAATFQADSTTWALGEGWWITTTVNADNVKRTDRAPLLIKDPPTP